MQTTAVAERTPEPAPAAAPRLAWRPVSAIAGAVAALLLGTSWRYGFFGDELYFRAAGRHLGSGLADQPPLVPLVARAMDLLFGDSVVGTRLPVIALVVTGVYLSALIARELGGGKLAQLLTAGVFAVSPFFMYGAGHTLSTQSFDSFFWTLISWLLVRWVRKRDDRLLLYAALATAVGLQAKAMLVAFWIGIAIAVLLLGPRVMLIKKQLWLGALVAAALAVPFLLWQRAHDWPQAAMTEVVAKEIEAAGGGKETFFPVAYAYVAGPLGAAMLIVGVLSLLFAPTLRPFRFYGLAAAGIIAAFWYSDGRPFYMAGLFVVCWAAAAVVIEQRKPKRAQIRWIAGPIYAVCGVLMLWGLPSGPPIWPLSHFENQPFSPANMHLEEFGWPHLVDAVERAYKALPESERATTTVLAGHYWQAGALDEYGPERGLPPVHSPHRGYWYFGTPPETATTALVVGFSPADAESMFADVKAVTLVDNGQRINNGTQGQAVFICREPLRSWAENWQRMSPMQS
ncbi:ArnT family glycosyltransferase [Amycolatopsis magusensis]|uniref:FtsH-binding integral membrane protein n=1 Tax=Amycolatopsis magusensis TaxID=882444 RepID=A0ABS4PQF2_9PSEU|nr:glycosyltransferase family 39 protein [Amycolatopsis magusensis]MBP2181652.1 FtsH-binding integral membrane protein [Amycolatopsis magusensis]